MSADYPSGTRVRLTRDVTRGGAASTRIQGGSLHPEHTWPQGTLGTILITENGKYLIEVPYPRRTYRQRADSSWEEVECVEGTTHIGVDAADVEPIP